MGKCKLATLQRLFESLSQSPHPLTPSQQMHPTPPTLIRCLMLQREGRCILMYSFRSALCTLLK